MRVRLFRTDSCTQAIKSVIENVCHAHQDIGEEMENAFLSIECIRGSK